MAKKKLSKPSQDYILGRLAEQKKRYADEHKGLDATRMSRELSWKVNIPPQLEKMAGATGITYHDSTIQTELFDLPTIFTQDPPTLSLTTDKESSQAESLTTRLEKFTTIALLEECGCREPGPSTFERLADATFEGGGWTRLVKDKDLWDERYAIKRKDFDDDEDYDEATEEAKKRHAIEKRGVPIDWTCVDTATLFPIYDGHRLTEMIEVQKRSLSATFRQYGLGFDGDGNIVPEETSIIGWGKNIADGAECEFVQHWDAHHCSYLIVTDGSGMATGGKQYTLKQWEHKYGLGKPPYFFSPGWMKNYERGRVIGTSASEPKRRLVEQLSFLRTIFNFITIRDAMPPMNREMPVDAVPIIGEDGQPVGPQSYELGKTYTGVGRIMPLQFADNTANLKDEMAQLRQDIENMSARGSGNGNSGDSGFALSIEYERDQRRFSQFKNGITRSLSEVTSAFWKLVQSLDERVYVLRTGDKSSGWVYVDPEDFDTAVRADWTLNANSTSAQIILERYLAARVQNGSMSVDQMIEALGANVDEVHEGRAKDRIRMTDWFMKAEEAEVLAGWGKGDVLKLQQEAEQMAQMEAQQAQQMQMAQQQGMGDPTAQMGGMGAGGLPSQGIVPDTGSLAFSPNGAGAQPGQEMQMAIPEGFPASPQVRQDSGMAQLG